MTGGQKEAVTTKTSVGQEIQEILAITSVDTLKLIDPEATKAIMAAMIIDLEGPVLLAHTAPARMAPAPAQTDPA